MRIHGLLLGFHGGERGSLPTPHLGISPNRVLQCCAAKNDKCLPLPSFIDGQRGAQKEERAHPVPLSR